MGKAFRRMFSMVAALAIFVSAFAVNLSALEAYDPYSYDRWWDPIPSQVGYYADYFADGVTLGCGAFNEPSGMHVSRDGLIYIADKNNDRIVVTDIEVKTVVREMRAFNYNGEVVTLNKPSDVFVDQYTGFIYICDSDNERVVKCDTEGNVERFFTKPDSELYSDELSYIPSKVIVDKAGIVYVIVPSVTRGAVMFSPAGDFVGFYGANRVETTGEILANAFWSLISSEEQRGRSVRSTPLGFTGFDIDDNGFIYTVTDSQDTSIDLLKKLNPRGDNIIDSLGVDEAWIFGDVPPLYYSIHARRSRLVDVNIGPNGEINILDFQNGRIFQYDSECWLMFVMGGIGEQLGTFRSPAALASYENKLFVLDSRKNNITVFTRTAFGELVTEATVLYIGGFFEESLEPWQQVLKYDGNYRRAYGGIGAAHFGNLNYGEAMKYFKLARYQGYYSRALAGYRDEWMRSNFNAILTAVSILIVCSLTLKLLFKFKILKKPQIRKLFSYRGKSNA
ncbi:MAG: NHL repeat-containing protein [Oscillospiraceae bacterium]|nr:NHL repeat-containing protein [Oscillospiraceae bacterium]